MPAVRSVYALREMGLIPAVGPYEAAVTTALSLGERIGIITTDEAGILNEEKKASFLTIADIIPNYWDDNMQFHSKLSPIFH